MASKLRVGGVTIDSNTLYNGKEVIRLCNVSFENGMRTAKQTQVDIEQALQRAYDRGYHEGKQARSDEITGVLEALNVLKEYFQTPQIRCLSVSPSMLLSGCGLAPTPIRMITRNFVNSCLNVL